MRYSWRFQLTLILVAVVSAIAMMAAEYNYDASSATMNIILLLILTFSALFGFSRSAKPLHWIGQIIIHIVTFICIIVLLWSWLIADQDRVQRAYMIAHLSIILMSCKFIQVYRTRDNAQIFIFTMLLMVVSAITCTSITLVPIFIIYIALAGYALIIYHLQRQVELVTATRLIGIPAGSSELENVRREVKGFWSQLGHGRFNVTCMSLLLFGLILAAIVFFMFPRLETGSLLGGRFVTKAQGGFSSHIQFGQIDKSETLRQVVTRVAITQNGQTIGGRNHPYYLRCTALDQYWKCRVETDTLDVKPAFWSRSLLSYILQKPFAETDCESTTVPPVEQDYLLSQWDTPYLPTLYPVQSIECVNDLNLRLGRLDRVVNSFNVNPESLHYVGYSLADISSRQAFVWFKTHLEIMGHYWLMYGADSSFGLDRTSAFSETITDIANSIAQPQIEKRRQLSRNQLYAFSEWNNYRSQQNPSLRKIQSLWDVFKISQEDPNIITDLKYHQLLQDTYEPAVEMADLDRDIAQNVVDYLRENYRYSVVCDIPLSPDVSQSMDKEVVYYDPVDTFLSKPGASADCEMFSAAMVQICRALGMRARLAVGYLAHEYVPEFGYYIVRQCDAHSWVEVYTADKDWMIFDPTPLDLDKAGKAKSKLAAFFQHIDHQFENIQYRWLKFSISNKGQQALVWANRVSDWLEHLDNSAKTLSNSTSADRIRKWFTHQMGESYFALFVRWMIFFCLLINIGIGIRSLVGWLLPKYRHRRVQKKYLMTYQQETIIFYRQMLEILQYIHFYKEPHLTPREFAFRAIEHDPAFAPVGKLSELYYRVRFGQLDVDAKKQEVIDNALMQLQIFTKSVRKTLKRPWPWEQTD